MPLENGYTAVVSDQRCELAPGEILFIPPANSMNCSLLPAESA